MMLWALSYAAENRIQTTNLTVNTVVPATSIQLSNLFPSERELDHIRLRMKTIIERILTANIPFLKENIQSFATKHIRHQYWRESSKKSNIINLGVMQENPSTTAGTIKILEDLHQYVPIKDGKLYPLICYGDGLSCERHNDAHKARATGATGVDRLEGLEPSAQEFHKRMILMQDTMDMFFIGSSITEKGTLCHLRNVFGHRNVKKDVGDCFNNVADFLRFVSIGYTVLSAMHILQMKSLHNEPLDWGTVDSMSAADKKKYLDDLSSKVLDRCWHDYHSDDVLNATVDTQEYPYCFCRNDIEDVPMIECSGPKCRNEWFHLECVDMTVENIPDGDWYCSEVCRLARGRYQYCVCQIETSEQMIGCDNDACPRGSWFHLSCIGMTEMDIPEGEWFCSSNCRHGKDDGVDYKYSYVKALMWHGLLDLARRDAVRENDGPSIISHWKHDLIQFYNKNHSKYVILAHRLLMGVAGWLPPRLRKDLIWNRTVNLTGGPGRNLEMDLVNEFLNKEFKDSLQQVGGNVTEETVARHSRLVGHLGKELTDIYATKIGGYDVKRHVHTQSWEHADVNMFVNLMIREDLFIIKPGRSFQSFPEFQLRTSAKHPARLKKKCIQLSKKLDRDRTLMNRMF